MVFKELFYALESKPLEVFNGPVFFTPSCEVFIQAIYIFLDGSSLSALASRIMLKSNGGLKRGKHFKDN